MQNIDIQNYQSSDPHVCTMLLKLDRNVIKIGSFVLQGDIAILSQFVGKTLGEINGVPQIPDMYKNIILTKIANIHFIKEIELVFEPRR